MNAAVDTLEPAWRWLDHDQAGDLADAGAPVTEALRAGQGLMTCEAFARALRAGSMEVLLLPGHMAALITWGMCPDGLTMNVLTVTGSVGAAREAFIQLELAARHSEAKQIISIGHPGWRRLVESIGYETNPRLFMRKLLT